jgi:hypothetical protein
MLDPVVERSQPVMTRRLPMATQAIGCRRSPCPMNKFPYPALPTAPSPSIASSHHSPNLKPSERGGHYPSVPNCSNSQTLTLP